MTVQKHPTSPWTPAANDLLVAMWADGRTARQISERLATARLGEFSRGAVIGRARRMGLEARRIANCRPKKENDKPLPDLGARHKGCQGFDGEPSPDDRLKCGAPVFRRTAWCEEHYKRSYGNPNWRQE